MKKIRDLFEYVIDVVLYVFQVVVLALGVLYIMAAIAQLDTPDTETLNQPIEALRRITP